MDIKDALLITLFGMAVVIAGLVLIQVMIHLFSVLTRVDQWLARSKQEKSTTPNVVTPPPVAVTPNNPAKPIEPEIITAITAVLEIELRLRASLVEGKFTFSR